MPLTRRRFLAAAAAATASLPALRVSPTSAATAGTADMRLGLVTYLWGQDWDLATLLANCAAAAVPGVELRTEHKHGVEPSLSPAQRAEVRQRFADSPVTLVGYGSNAEYHSNDPAELRRNIELTKAYIRLMHDCGGSGVKVKPNSFVKDVPHQRTLDAVLPPVDPAGGADSAAQVPPPPEFAPAAVDPAVDEMPPPPPPVPPAAGGQRSVLVPDRGATPLSPADELAALRRQAELLKQQLDQIQRRIEELEQTKRR